MRVKRALGLGMLLAAIAAGPAAAATPELSVTQRLQDRREVAAGTRAQVLGFEDGRFYANGWHITGEMGGIVTPPLKLLDSLYFGVNGEWVGPATNFTSGWGYTRYDLPSIDGIELARTDFVPDGRRGALLGLKLTNPGAEPASRERDGRRALRADDAVPVGLQRHDPERERQRPRQRRVRDGDARVPRHRAASGRGGEPLLHGDRRLGPRRRGRRDRAGPLRPVRRRPDAARDQSPAPMPSGATTARSARAPAAACATGVDVPGAARRRSGSRWPARTSRAPRRAASSPS